MAEAELELARRLERGDEVVMATVIQLDRDPPSRAGAKLLMDRRGPIAGTLGCAEFDAAAQVAVGALMDSGTTALRRLHHDLGEIDVYLEAYPGRPHLLVVTATPVAAHLLKWAPELGFSCHLFDPRAPRPTGFDQTPLLESADDLDTLGSRDLYVVFTDHDADHIQDLLERLLGSPQRLRFVGLMGSRRHVQPRLRSLPADLPTALVRSPVGLALGGAEASEIALSILAGLVAVRRGGSGGWLDQPSSSQDR